MSHSDIHSNSLFLDFCWETIGNPIATQHHVCVLIDTADIYLFQSNLLYIWVQNCDSFFLSLSLFSFPSEASPKRKLEQKVVTVANSQSSPSHALTPTLWAILAPAADFLLCPVPPLWLTVHSFLSLFDFRSLQPKTTPFLSECTTGIPVVIPGVTSAMFVERTFLLYLEMPSPVKVPFGLF